MTVIATPEPSRHVWRAARQTSLAPAFRRARRHSRVVRALRIGIPVVVGTVVVLYGLADWFNPLAGLPMPSIGGVGISGTRITMDAPRLAGFNRDGRSYELTAASAAQDLKQPQFIELQGVRAKMQLQDGNTVDVTAEAGLYDTKAEIVTLNKDVRVVTTSGTTVELVEATLDMRKNHVTSNKPVAVIVADGRVDAQQMEIVNGGEIVYFRGGVHMSLDRSPSVPLAASASPKEGHP